MSTEQILKRVQAVVLLEGGARPSPLTRVIGRSRLNLPLDNQQDLLAHWCQEVEAFARSTRLPQCPLWVRVGVEDIQPIVPANGGVEVRVEQDASAFRGTGGVIRDLVEDFDPGDYLIVASAAQVLLTPLSELAVELASLRADVALLSHEDGTPCGFWLIRCGAMLDLPKIGFTDLKEQALPRLAGRHAVRILSRSSPATLPVRTHADYLGTLRRLQQIAGEGDGQAPFAEGWQSSFSLVEPGADVADSARIHDSVVLAGASISQKAVVVRSIIGPGSTVGIGQQIVDTMTGSSTSHGRGHT